MTAGEATREYYREQGRQQERKRLIEMLTARVCFDHLEGNNCTHNACFNNMDMVAKLKEEK